MHRALNRRLDGYIAISDSVADEARARREVRDADIVVIPSGIALPAPSAVAAARVVRLGLAQPVAVFVGRLERERRVDILVRAMSLVLARLPRCHLVIAGSGGEEERLKEFAEELGVGHAITWAGWVADPYSVLAAAHVYVNPLLWEGFGMAMAEAMAMALPVVAFDSGASGNMVQPEVTGLLVTPGDAKGLAADIVRLASDRVYAAQLGEAGRRRATALYGARSTALASLDLYRGLRGTAPS